MATDMIVLRLGDARDIADVDRIMRGAFDPRFGEAWTRNQCMGVLAMPGVALTIAHIAEAPAGFALVRTILDEAELLLLAVSPDHRRRGLGSALMRAVIADAAARGTRALHLEVRANNEAVTLYRDQGMVKIGERKGYYRGSDGRIYDAHTYSRAIG